MLRFKGTHIQQPKQVAGHKAGKKVARYIGIGQQRFNERIVGGLNGVWHGAKILVYNNTNAICRKIKPGDSCTQSKGEILMIFHFSALPATFDF